MTIGDKLSLIIIIILNIMTVMIKECVTVSSEMRTGWQRKERKEREEEEYESEVLRRSHMVCR
jgi:hypothetical protein